MEEKDPCETEEEPRNIITEGSLEDLIAVVENLYITEFSDKDPLWVNSKINALLEEEMPLMKAYVAGEISAEELKEELKAKCLELPQIRLNETQKIEFAIDPDADAENPGIIIKYFY